MVEWRDALREFVLLFLAGLASVGRRGCGVLVGGRKGGESWTEREVWRIAREVKLVSDTDEVGL